MVRAKVWSTGRFRKPSGYGRHRGWNGLTWHFAAYAGETLVLYDNTGDYEKMMKAALIRVEALRHMQIAGHKLKAYKA